MSTQTTCELKISCFQIQPLTMGCLCFIIALLNFIFFYPSTKTTPAKKKKNVMCQLKACCRSVTGLYLTLCDPWTAACQASLSFTIAPSLLVELVVPSNHLILCHSLLLLSSIFSNFRVFSSKSALCIRWPKY